MAEKKKTEQKEIGRVFCNIAKQLEHLDQDSQGRIVAALVILFNLAGYLPSDIS